MNRINNLNYKNKYCLYKDDNRIASFDEFHEAYFKACEYFSPPNGWAGQKIECKPGSTIEIKVVPTLVK